MAITITQATEAGTVYSLDEIDRIAAIARKHIICHCIWTAPALPMPSSALARRRPR